MCEKIFVFYLSYSSSSHAHPGKYVIFRVKGVWNICVFKCYLGYVCYIPVERFVSLNNIGEDMLMRSGPDTELAGSWPGFRRNWVPKIGSCKIFGRPNL